MKQVIYRQNKMFIIDREQLKPKARSDEICNALYAAIYTEFLGASENPVYKELNNLERFTKINVFANEWLQKRGLI